MYTSQKTRVREKPTALLDVSQNCLCRGGTEPDLFPQPAIATCASPHDGKLLLEARAFICWPRSNKYIARKEKTKKISSLVLLEL